MSTKLQNGTPHVVWGDLVDSAHRRLDDAASRGGIVSVRLVGSDIDPLSWLVVQDTSPRFFFSDRSRHDDVAAVGSLRYWKIDGPADRTDIGRMIDSISPVLADGRRVYGGTRFDSTIAAEEEWHAYGSAHFFLPRIEVRRTGERVEFWLHADASDADDLIRAHEAIDGMKEVSASLKIDGVIEVESRRDHPPFEIWQESVEEILSVIRQSGLEKAVLARAATYDSADLDAFALFGRVRTNTPHCYHIAFEPEAGRAFLSATPERLFRRSGQRLVSEAVAGTRPRGEMAEDDARFRDELLASDKDRREHAVVGRSIVAGLERLCSRVDLDVNPTEMRLKGNRHLKSVVRATLLPETSTGDVFAALHPTPAVGGWPTDDALALIDRIEPFDRGWYAGAIGWIGEDEAELTVGIRSALVEPGAIRLYSGAGIVEGSVADAEWSEVEQKIDSFLNVIASPAPCHDTTIRG